MAITQVPGSYHNMPVIFHQEAGQTVKITPGRFYPRCHETRYRIIDEGFLQCDKCGRSYFVPSQEQSTESRAVAPVHNEGARDVLSEVAPRIMLRLLWRIPL